MIAIVGGLGAAVAWAISTLCSSRSSRLIAPVTVVAWVMLTGLVITAPVAAIRGIPGNLDTSSGAWLALSGAGNVGGLMLAYASPSPLCSHRSSPRSPRSPRTHFLVNGSAGSS
jgi:drug/metabolite transporter (DMT)-like permease